MAILDMLNRGVITAAEAKDLLKTLQGHDNSYGRATEMRKEFTQKVNEAIDKTEDVFGTILDKVEDQYDKVEPTLKKTYDKVQPKVKDIADIVSEKVEDIEPLFKGTVSYFAGVVDDMKSEINEVRKKYAEKKDETMGDIFDGDAEEVDDEEEDEYDIDDESDDEDIEDDDSDDEEKNDNMAEVLSTLNNQLHELNDAESFLRSAFGEDIFDYDEDEDDSI